MDGNYLLFWLSSLSASFPVGIVAREAIVGGQLAVFPELQYHVTILTANHAPRCGGGIIADYFILTAAHCVIASDSDLINKPISILANAYNLEVPGLLFEVEKVFVPLEYNPHNDNPTGDIAMLKLRNSLNLEEHFTKLFLQHIRRKDYYADKPVKIAGLGWDKIYENNELIGEYTDHRMRIANAVVLNETQCQHDHPNRTISNSQICARVKPSLNETVRYGVCIGDGGGPLVFNGKVLVGILSITTVGCSERISSGIYTQVVSYRKFINDTMRGRTLYVRTYYV